MRSPEAQFWLVTKDEKILGGMVMLAHGRHRAYWHGAYFSSSFDLHASKYLTHQIILDSKAKGFKYLDSTRAGAINVVRAAFRRWCRR